MHDTAVAHGQSERRRERADTMQGTMPLVIVVDPSAPRRRRAAAALRDAGWCPVEAATPLELVDLLERAGSAVTAIALAPATETQTHRDEIVAFLSEEHPRVRLALIGDDPSPVPELIAELP
jgi:CheY-like chemotaxis protein